MSLRASFRNEDNRNHVNQNECSYPNEPLSRDDGVTVAEMSSHSDANPGYSLQLRCMKTVALSISSFGLGTQVVLIGTTMVHLSVLFNQPFLALSAVSSTETVCTSAGVIFMSLVIDRLEFEFVVAFMTVTAGLANVFMLFSGFLGMFAIMIVKGFAEGCCACVFSLYMVDTWHGTRFRDMAVQWSTTALTIGETVSPFVISLFLADLPSESIRITNSSTVDSVTNSQVVLWTPQSTVSTVVIPASNNSTTNTIDGRQISDVRFSYVYLGLATIACALPALFVYCYGGLHRPCLSSPRQTTGKQTSTGNRLALATVPVTLSRKRKFAHVSWTVAIGFVDATIQIAAMFFLTPFALEQLKWSAIDSALITSVYFGSSSVASVIGALLALVLSPGKMLAGYFVLTAVGYGAFLGVTSTAAATNAPVAVWLLTAVIALGQWPIPNTMLLLLYNDCRSISITTTTAAKLAGYSVGAVLSTVAIGYLLEAVSPFWIVYIPLIGLVVQSLLLLFRQLFLIASAEQNRRDLVSEKTVGDGFDNTVDNLPTSLTKFDEKTYLLSA